MTTIKIKKNESQHLTDSNIYRVDGKMIIAIDESNITSVLWTFRCNSETSVPLLHSRNTEEGVFLNYSDRYNPLFEITVPETGAYTIVLVGQVHTTATQNVEVTKMDSTGTPITSLEEIDMVTIETFESEPMVINIDHKGWF
jgi:hypothetical protein